MTGIRLVRRLLFIMLCFGALAGVGVVSVLAWPQTFHAHTAGHGRLLLHSDKPFDLVGGQSLLADIERRLARAPPELHAKDVV